jgi:hypothetical protein
MLQTSKFVLGESIGSGGFGHIVPIRIDNVTFGATVQLYIVALPSTEPGAISVRCLYQVGFLFLGSLVLTN